MGDGETFEEVLIRADMIERHIRRMHDRGLTAHAARTMLDYADDLITAELERGVATIPAEGAPLSIAELIGAADWPGASEATKALLESMGAPSGAFRVYVVPESANVTVDLGGGA